LGEAGGSIIDVQQGDAIEIRRGLRYEYKTLSPSRGKRANGGDDTGAHCCSSVKSVCTGSEPSRLAVSRF
jgi:hypothetical protein